MSGETEEPRESAARWRPVVLNTFLRVFVPCAGIAVASGVREAVADGNPAYALMMAAPLCLTAWAMFASGSTHSTRASVSLGAMLGLGLALIPYRGFNANVSALLTGAPMLALLTLGWGAALFSVAVASVGFAAAAVSIAVFGWVAPHDPLTTVVSVRFLFGYLAFGGGSVAGVHYIIRRLERTTSALSERTLALRQSEAEFRGLFDHVFEGVFRTSYDGALLTANRALAEMLGYESAEELLRVDLTRDVYLRGNDREDLRRRLERAGELRDEDVTFKRKDGREIYVAMNARAVRDASGDVSYEGTVVDLTARRRLEEQLAQAGKMDAVGRLAGGVAHDFNNLLTIILGYTDILHGSLPKGTIERQHLEAIRVSASSASDLTRQLLAFSRKQILKPQAVDLNAIVSKALSLLRRVLGEDIIVDTVLAEPLDVVHADPGQIEQVIMNLCVNARDAMAGGGRLTIRTANVDVSTGDAAQLDGVSAGPHVTLTVSDTGIGMNADVQSRIFEPFFTTKEPSKGTGLGLATVYGIVRQSGGSVSVRSQPGAGTAFTIHLPQAASSATASAPATTMASLGGTETILVVEDEEEVRAIISLFLTAQGYTVLEAESGIDALQLCERHPRLDLVLTDVIMPGMGGQDLAARLATSFPMMRVLMMSGYTDDAILNRGALEPGRAILQKPFTRQALLESVRRALDGLASAR